MAEPAVGEEAGHECVLCPPLRFRFNAMAGLPGEAGVIAADRDFLLIPDVAPLADGHVLLVTRDHHQCAGGFGPEMWGGALRWRDRVARLYREAYGSGELLLFEHGPATSQGGGACIDHAHWHLMPGTPGVRAVVEREGRSGTPADHATLRACLRTGRSYLLVEENGIATVHPGDGVRSQFLRWAVTAPGERAAWRWQETFGLPDSRRRFLRTRGDARRGGRPAGRGSAARKPPVELARRHPVTEPRALHTAGVAGRVLHRRVSPPVGEHAFQGRRAEPQQPQRTAPHGLVDHRQQRPEFSPAGRRRTTQQPRERVRLRDDEVRRLQHRQHDGRGEPPVDVVRHEIEHDPSARRAGHAHRLVQRLPGDRGQQRVPVQRQDVGALDPGRGRAHVGGGEAPPRRLVLTTSSRTPAPPSRGRSRSITDTPFGTPRSTRRWSSAPSRRSSSRITAV